MALSRFGFCVEGPISNSALDVPPATQEDFPGACPAPPPDPPANMSLEATVAKCAQVNSNIVRVNVIWADFEPSPGQYNYSRLNSLLRAVQLVKDNTQRVIRILPVFRHAPSWVDGWHPDKYPTYGSGYSQYGYSCVQMLNYLNNPPSNLVVDGTPITVKNNAEFVELCNEPNIVGLHSDNVPAAHYGGMCAYALYWMTECLLPAGVFKGPLCGALSVWPGPNQALAWKSYIQGFGGALASNLMQLYPLATEGTKFQQAYASWRLSIHTYPFWGGGQGEIPFPGCTQSPFLPRFASPATDPGNTTGDRDWQSAISTVQGSLSAVRAFVESSRKIWVTETGVSARKIGNATRVPQSQFFLALLNDIQSRTLFEGVTIWPHNDGDWGQSDPQSLFYQFAVVDTNYQNYSAGYTIEQKFGQFS